MEELKYKEAYIHDPIPRFISRVLIHLGSVRMGAWKYILEALTLNMVNFKGIQARGILLLS